MLLCPSGKLKMDECCLQLAGQRLKPKIFMCHKSVKNTKFVVTRYGSFKLKMHQNPFFAWAPPPRTPL